jgi:hypothetical protein
MFAVAAVATFVGAVIVARATSLRKTADRV